MLTFHVITTKRPYFQVIDLYWVWNPYYLASEFQYYTVYLFWKFSHTPRGCCLLFLEDPQPCWQSWHSNFTFHWITRLPVRTFISDETTPSKKLMGWWHTECDRVAIVLSSLFFIDLLIFFVAIFALFFSIIVVIMNIFFFFFFFFFFIFILIISWKSIIKHRIDQGSGQRWCWSWWIAKKSCCSPNVFSRKLVFFGSVWDQEIQILKMLDHPSIVPWPKETGGPGW